MIPMVERSERFELPTLGVEDRSSVQAELRAHSGWDDRNRTDDTRDFNALLYQAELLPIGGSASIRTRTSPLSTTRRGSNAVVYRSPTDPKNGRPCRVRTGNRSFWRRLLFHMSFRPTMTPHSVTHSCSITIAMATSRQHEAEGIAASRIYSVTSSPCVSSGYDSVFKGRVELNAAQAASKTWGERRESNPLNYRVTGGGRTNWLHSPKKQAGWAFPPHPACAKINRNCPMCYR